MNGAKNIFFSIYTFVLVMSNMVYIHYVHVGYMGKLWHEPPHN